MGTITRIPVTRTYNKRLVQIKHQSLINAGVFDAVPINAGSLINAGLKLCYHHHTEVSMVTPPMLQSIQCKESRPIYKLN